MTDIREKTILIIDDEEVIRQSFSDYLEDLDFRTLTAENGRIGVEMFDREKVDLVLVDLRMPEMNGMEVMAHIRERSQDTPLIVVSGTGVIADAVAALHQGAWDYLLKPVKDLSILAHAVDMALEKARLKMENRLYQQHLEQMVADRTKALEEANKHLRTSERNLSSMMENTLDGVIKIDKQFRHIFANTAIYDAVGLPPGQYLGKTNEEIDASKKLSALLRTKYEKVFLTGKTEIFEVCYPTVNRGKRIFQAVAAPEFDENNEVETIVNFMRDITDLKQAENALKESEALLDATGKMAKVGGWEMDAGTLDLKWTKQISLILELPLYYQPEFDDIIRFTHPDDRQAASNVLQRALNQGEPNDVELRLITAKDNLLWARAIVNPKIVDGKVVKLKGTFQDITVLKQAEQALRESERRYRSVIALSPLGVGIKSTEGVIVDANQALASMLGYDIEALLGLTAGDITHPDDLLRENELIKSLLSDEKTSYSLEKRYRHKNGNYFWINITVAKMLDLAGGQVFLFGFVEDISNRKQMELEREKLINKLQDALAEIKELRGFIPICSNCKKIRDDAGYWQQIEKYITDRTDAKFSHAVCPDCAKELYPDVYKRILEKKRSKY